MSVPDRSIDSRLLSAALEEFLDKGYENASLKEICGKAGVTTGALYKRFDGKEDLFNALVADTVRGMEQYGTAVSEEELKKLSDRDLYDLLSMSAEANLGWLRFLYERKERLKLLFKCASSTRYADFHHEVAEKMGEISYLSYLEARRRGMTERDLTKEEIHVLTTGVWAMICEPFVHDFTWEQIVEHAHLMQDFMDWHRVLGIKKPD
ncbi:MAG: TetR/AcrR family transcriptional regulator [Lachnospiraceae bacterium]|nr:TetR/AcrR family transcriptional regulator [Lachnospiraceae bacterium]